MSQNTDIEWTGKTWNFLRARVKSDAVNVAREKGYTSLFNILTGAKSDGITPRIIPGETWGYHCEIASAGCGRCYACTMNGRTLPAWGTGLPYDRRSRDLVEMYVDETELLKPLSWKKPTKIFPCSMTDLFAEFVPDEFIDRAFAMMAVTPRHTYQVLTKRADRLLAYVKRGMLGKGKISWPSVDLDMLDRWPLPNVQLGFSAEDQPNFDARWTHMQEVAKAGWFVWTSLEPLLGPIDVNGALFIGPEGGIDFSYTSKNWLRWAVVGGESGPGARAMNIRWVRSLIDVFRRAQCPLFVKQMGSFPILEPCRQHHYDFGDGIGRKATFSALEPMRPSTGMWRLHLDDRKGGTPEEWALDLRVRQFPEVRNV